MHHTQTAHNAHHLLALVTLIAGLGSAMMAQQLTTQVLDLTKPAPREQQETGLPGISVGGIGGQPPTRAYRLPLKIQLASVDPQPAKVGDKFTVELRVKNEGASVFFLPASQNSVAVLQHEGRGRRNLELNLIFEDRKSGRKISSVAAVTTGSETVNGSLLRIEPGGEVRVLFVADLRPISQWFANDLGEIQIRAGAAETIFEDQRYFIQSKSEEVVSENVQTINLIKP